MKRIKLIVGLLMIIIPMIFALIHIILTIGFPIVLIFFGAAAAVALWMGTAAYLIRSGSEEKNGDTKAHN